MFKKNGSFFADWYEGAKRKRKSFRTAREARAFEANRKKAHGARRSKASSSSGPKQNRRAHRTDPH